MNVHLDEINLYEKCGLNHYSGLLIAFSTEMC